MLEALLRDDTLTSRDQHQQRLGQEKIILSSLQMNVVSSVGVFQLLIKVKFFLNFIFFYLGWKNSSIKQLNASKQTMGNESVNKKFKEYIESNGISHFRFCSNTSPQNKLVERCHQSVLQSTWCILNILNYQLGFGAMLFFHMYMQ